MEQKKNLLENIYVVLVEPRNPGNIGSTARAMKNMGINHLRLVNPVKYRDDVEQKKLGYRSQEIIKASKQFKSLPDALKDVSLVFLATSKKGKWKRDFIFPEKAGKIISHRLKKERIALVFGREDSGVTIDESQMANYLIYVPTAVKYPSLNLSQAVLLVLYDIYRAVNLQSPLDLPRMAKKQDFERLYGNIWDLMKSLLIKEGDKGLFHRSLKRALNRTHWTKADVAVFDRACKQVRWFVQNRKKEDYKGEP